MFDETRWALADDEVAAIIARADVRPPAKVLDLCCGTGRHSLAFARRGFIVTGVDITQSYLEAAQETAAAEGLAIEFVHEDARDFSRPNTFDLCVNLGASFGYFAHAHEDRKVLRRCQENLAPGGRFVIEAMGKESVARNFVDFERFERDGWLVSAQYHIFDNWQKLHNIWHAQKGRACYEYAFAIRLYAATELEAILRRIGFSSIECYGDLAGTPYDEHVMMLVTFATVLKETQHE